MSVFRRIMLGGGIDIDINTLPDTQKIYYKATAKVTPKSNSLGAPLIANNWDSTTGDGIIVCYKDISNIGNDAFSSNTSLTSITIPNSVTSIGSSAFSNCVSLSSITISDSVTSIGESAFYGCTSLTSVTIPDSVTSIGSSAFYRCTSLSSITIPDGVTSIGSRAFSVCPSLTSIIVSEGNSVYDSRENCNAIIKTATNELVVGCSSTIIPESVTSIGESAFYICTSLTSITIPESVTSIGNSAFSECNSLISVTIPNSVTSIGDYAFRLCPSLISVYCQATTPPTLGGSTVFDNNGSGRKIYVPMESVEAYKSATNWSEYADAIMGYDFENNIPAE